MGGVLLASGTLVNNHAVAAQSVIGNMVPQPPVETLDQQAQPNEMDVFEPAGQAPESTVPQIFRYGQFQFRPFLDYRFTYGNGIQNQPGFSQDTIVQEVSPGILIDLGPKWLLQYSPTLRFYSNNQFRNGVDQNIFLTGGVTYEAWTFGLSQTVQLTSAPLAETGAQTDQSSYSTSLTASYIFNSRVTTDLSVNQAINLISGFQNSYDWNTLDWLNYEFWPRLNAGIGAGVGYVLVGANGQSGSSNPDQTYQQLQGRVNWRAIDKLSFQLNAGFEVRQFLASGYNTTLNPLFGLTIQYQPFESTELSINAGRTVAPSDYYLAAQQSSVITAGAYLNQRLFREFSAQLGVTYSVTDYNSPVAGLANNVLRTDDQISFNAQISHPFWKRGTWAVFYQYAHNTSTVPGFGYESNQVGFQLSFAY
jgi:hypothetical protein